MADTKVVINCPACGCDMEKVFIPAIGINLDVCTNGCGGIYFDNREFNRVDEAYEDITPLVSALEGKEFKKVDDTQIRVCPVCGMNMVKNYASSKHEVEIDECYGCGGKFLDYDELDKIRAEYGCEAERAADVLKELHSNVGIELQKFNQDYENQLKHSWSISSKIIREKYNNY